MRTRKLLVVATGLAVCLIIIWFSKSIEGSPKTYEVHPQIQFPDYGTDAFSVMDAYERLMDRYMGLTERNSVRIERDLGSVIRKLDSIDRKLNELSMRMSRIEKAVVTVKPQPPVEKKIQPKPAGKKVPKIRSSPS